MKVNEIYIDEKRRVNIVTDNKVFKLCTEISDHPDVYVSFEEDIPNKENVLTIVCNVGVHPMPLEQLPGEHLIATEGSLPMTENELTQAVHDAVKKCADKINELKPNKVYLVPSGLPVVLSQIQALCMQMLSKPGIILQWDRDANKYFEIDIVPREILTKI